MKIAVDVTPILPGGENGGAKQVVFALLRGFANHISPTQLTLLTTCKNNDVFREFEILGMRLVCVDRDDHRRVKIFKNLFFRIRKKKPLSKTALLLKKLGISVLFCPMTAPPFDRAGIPVVSIVYDLQHLFYPDFFSRQELSWRNYFYEKLSKEVAYVICISDYTRDSVVENLKIPSERVFTIPVCVQSRLTTPARQIVESVLKKYHLEGKRYCLFPANLWPHKNHKILLMAFNMFTRAYPRHRLHLVLTGKSVENSLSLVDAIKQMGLEADVHYLSYLEEEELGVIWDNCEILVFPSLFEGFGIPLVEAMRFGKPILASRATSIPEVAGDAALYFDPRKPDEIVACLCEIMDNKVLYSRLIKKGKEQLKRYDFDTMITSYLQILNQAVNGTVAK